jgi:hypothetical protein
MTAGAVGTKNAESPIPTTRMNPAVHGERMAVSLWQAADS